MTIITTLEPRQILAILLFIALVVGVSIGLYVTRPKNKNK